MEHKSFLRGIKQSDAPILRILRVFEGSLEYIGSKIRSISENPFTKLYIYGDETAFVLQISPSNRRKGTVSIFGTSSKEAIIELLDRLFKIENMYKLSFELSSHDSETELILSELGAVQEGILIDEPPENGEFDYGIFTIVRPCYRGYNVALIPFPRAILYVKGSENIINECGFLRYGESIEDSLIQDVSYYKGLLNSDKKLKPRGDEAYVFRDEEEINALPYEVSKAYIELKEYFSKRRESFDLNIEIEGTDFQKRVWEEISAIPYSYTCSYEDIAYSICGNDPRKARLTSRAVGKACSQNPLPVIIPCHRVLSSSGSLLGYTGGLDIKEFLLNHEAFSTFRL